MSRAIKVRGFICVKAGGSARLFATAGRVQAVWLKGGVGTSGVKRHQVRSSALSCESIFHATNLGTIYCRSKIMSSHVC